MRSWKIILSLFLLPLVLNGCSTLVKAPEPLQEFHRELPLAAYARVLQRYVNERGEVDFPALQRNRADLDYYVAYIARTPASHFTDGNERLTHYINSYNALSMYNVLESGIPKTHAGWAKVRFFYLRKLIIGGRAMSLYAYENDIIRKLGEPRIHFALNCSALGCPTLPSTPFSGKDLEQELDRETHKFFSEKRNLRVDHTKKKVYLSAILDFYTEDFTPAHAPSLIAYVNRYVPRPIPEDYSIDFIDYDWTVANSRR
jgi:hypothetical protein